MPCEEFLREAREGRRRLDQLRRGGEADDDRAPLLHELETAYECLTAAGEALNLLEEEVAATAEMAAHWRRHYEDLFRLAPDGYLVTDARGAIREANPAAAALLGVDAAGLAGRSLAGFIAPTERASFRARLHRLGPKAGRQEWEFGLRPRGLPPLRACLSVAAARDPDGQTAALHWLLRAASPRAPDPPRR